MLRINRENLRNSHEGPWLLLDLVMLGILIVNLVWLLFDNLYETRLVYDTLLTYLPGFVAIYNPLHDNFLFVDLVFIGVFLSEFCVRWIASVRRKEHLRWYFYPFIHWYDIVGMIPLGATRMFRLLRLVSILYRLHKYQIIDLNQTALFRFLAFYYDVIVEELSDRIVAKVLTDAQKDIAAGSPLIDDVVNQVLAPRKALVSQWVAAMLNHLGSSFKDQEHGAVIREHVRTSVGKAVKDNSNIATLSLVPVIGKTIEDTLESTITDIVNTSLIHLLTDVDAHKVDEFISKGITDFSPSEQALDHEMLLVINECLELIKGHVSQQRWKLELASTQQPEVTVPAKNRQA